jgi:hypothetical protein
MFNSTFLGVWIIAFLIGLIFWASTNLIDAFYLGKIWEEDKKEYWSSTYWLIFSIIIFFMMFLSSFIDKNYGFNILMYILWTIVLLINFLNIKRIL